MAEDVNPLTRNELAKFLPNQRAIRAFENLFNVPTQVDTNTASIEQANLEASSSRNEEVSLQAQVTLLKHIVDGLAQAPVNDIERKPACYAMFLSTSTQTAALANTAYAVTFNTVSSQQGVAIGSPSSRLVVGADGVYIFSFSLQLDKTTSPVGLFWVWARLNGVDVPNTASQVRIQGNNAEVLVNQDYVFKLSAGDYMELMWAVDSTTTQLTYSAASGVVPAIPSAKVTITDHN